MTFDNVADPRILHLVKGDLVEILSQDHPSQWWVGRLVVGLGSGKGSSGSGGGGGGSSGNANGIVGLVNPRRVARMDYEAASYECVALGASDPKVEEDLRFSKGDKIEILEENHPSPKWVGRRKRVTATDGVDAAAETATDAAELGLVSPALVVRSDNPVLFAVVANYGFEGEGEEDLSFAEGDRIEIVQDHFLRRADVWVGRLNGKYGILDAEMVTAE